MTHDDRVEQVMERALSSYADAEPVAGLEERILSRIPSGGIGGGTFGRWGWGLAASLAVVLVLAAIAVRTPSVPERSGEVVERQIAATPVPAVHPVEPKLRKKVHRRRALAARALPKQERFPTPSAMTDEERALVAFVKRDPAQALEEFTELAKRTERDGTQ
ncbi:MAG TPA: hypothetical protein VGL97_03990 [Bryobacteraceae bacterium]|jgi:hypothetical protein